MTAPSTTAAGDTSRCDAGRRRPSTSTTSMASSYTSGATISIITPTRNRAELWRSGRLLDSLRAQTEPPDELVIALDHTEDDTLAAIGSSRMPFPIRILEVLSPRPGPDPASAIPDNCLFAAAAGVILVHLDDDIAIGLDFCRRVRTLLPLGKRAILWHQLFFVTAQSCVSPRNAANDDTLSDTLPVDYRTALALRRHWPISTGGIIQLPANRMLHWGGAWSAPRAELLAIGGHDLSLAGYRNADARLGNRLVRNGLTSFITSETHLAATHIGTTRRSTTHSRGPTGGPRIANGGISYWTSDACHSSYRVTKLLDSQTQ